MRRHLTPLRLAAAGLVLVALLVGLTLLAPSDSYLFLPNRAKAVAPLLTIEGVKRTAKPDDGQIFFSEATVRYEMHEWATDGLEARGNGRIICYDTNTQKTHTVIDNLIFPNGVCIASDGQSFIFAETWGCTVKRHWFAGPKKGTTVMLIPAAANREREVTLP